MNGTHLVARLDNIGDVVLTGPAVRAVAASAGPVTYLAGPHGAAAARLLPGVGDVMTYDAAWVPYDAKPLDRDALDRFVADIAARAIDTALIFTSYHQSPLPLALLLRMAGVRCIAATSTDYPGSLLDVRVPYLPELHEVEQALEVCAAAGYRLPDGDGGELRLQRRITDASVPGKPYVVVHPCASVPARGLPTDTARGAVAALAARGWRVLVTGGASDAEVCRYVASGDRTGRADSCAGATSLEQLVDVVAGASAVVSGNTGIVHLAAATGTPVVEAFAPVVAPERWHPWKVPHVLLGQTSIACAGCRSRTCPMPGQPCLAPCTADSVVAAVELLAAADRVPSNNGAAA